MWNPRVGGEKELDDRFKTAELGSPPRRRGKGVRSGVHRCCRWITPAQAGKSHPCRCGSAGVRDHPRTGGEKGSTSIVLPMTLGSPPRRRGKDLKEEINSLRIRITPAWAGKSPDPPTPPTSGGDHPRVGGEKDGFSNLTKKQQGSPPRGRGKVSSRAAIVDSMGITPAWAGKRWVWCWPPPPLGDHPRVGGEKVMCNSRDVARLGSPPRGRGKVCIIGAAFVVGGITPAWAGKRDKPALILRVVKDHPRVGGEKSHAAPVVRTGVGSPPRGRGKVFVCFLVTRSLRITPAWAGKRYAQGGASTPGGDHPRVGGEKALIGRCLFGLRGSPPRGRGKERPYRPWAAFIGITPAWAGKRRNERVILWTIRDHPRVGGEKRCTAPISRSRWGSPPRGRGKAAQSE